LHFIVFYVLFFIFVFIFIGLFILVLFLFLFLFLIGYFIIISSSPQSFSTLAGYAQLQEVSG